MTWDQIHDWYENFYLEVIEGKKPIRGRCFSGSKIEVWGRDNIIIELHDPFLRGESEDNRALDFVKNLFDQNHQKITAEIDFERFKRVVSGEEPLADADWQWPDELDESIGIAS